jgi:hypothetical protein
VDIEDEWNAEAADELAKIPAKAAMLDNMEAKRPTTTEIVYTAQDGSQEVRYRRPYNSADALELVGQVLDLQRIHGAACPYIFRHVA